MERDDIVEYSLDAHHSEEKGKQIRKTIWKVTLILSIITAAEVLLGAFVKQGSGLWTTIKMSFIILTLVKAAYIVLVFMHLGDERKIFKWTILLPYTIFIIYLLFIALTEGSTVGPNM